jgi:hypothetical protein
MDGDTHRAPVTKVAAYVLAAIADGESHRLDGKPADPIDH